MDLKIKDNSKLKLSPITQLEYIESTGTQYLAIDLPVKSTWKVEAKIQGLGTYSSSVSAHVLFSSGNVSGTNVTIECIFTSASQIRMCRDVRENWLLPNSPQWGDVLTITSAPTFVRVNNSELTNKVTPADTSVEPILRIFSGLNLTATPKCEAKLWYFKIYDNDILVRNFIPAKDLSDVACLYDTISQSFFYNQGTGDFVAGPTVPPTITSLPDNILLKTTSLYHENTPNVDGLSLLNIILNYQKTHQDEVKDYYYKNTQIWNDIITEYPIILPYYKSNIRLISILCESQDPMQAAQNFANITTPIESIAEEYPAVRSLVVDNINYASIINEWNTVVHALVDTGKRLALCADGNQVIEVPNILKKSKFETEVLFNNLPGEGNGMYCIITNSETYPEPRFLTGYTRRFFMTYSSDHIVDLTISTNTWYHVSTSTLNGNSYIKINDKYSTTWSPDRADIIGILRLFSSKTSNLNGKMTSVKIYDVDDNLLGNFVPFYRNDKYGYLDIHDLSNPTFYSNTGTGQFTYTLEPKT